MRLSFFVGLLLSTCMLESAAAFQVQTPATTTTGARKGNVKSMKPGHRLMKGDALRIMSKLNNGRETDDEQSIPDHDTLPKKLISATSIAAQPVVWVSLYCLKTTGSGLPAGPFGLIGAVEGVSYLIILVQALGLGNKITSSESSVRQVSAATLAAGLLVLLSLVVDQGCVPNAKPILDYSNYLPICETK